MILSRAVLVSFSGHCRRSTRGSMPRRPAPPPFCIIIPHIRRICKKPRAGPRKAIAGSAGLVPEHHHLFAVWTIPALVKVMRFYGLPASEEHSADMLQLRLSHPSRIERRPAPILQTISPVIISPLQMGHCMIFPPSGFRLLCFIIPYRHSSCNRFSDQAAMRQAAMQRVCADIKAAQAGDGRQTRKLSERHLKDIGVLSPPKKGKAKPRNRCSVTVSGWHAVRDSNPRPSGP